jgi:hypothetical protein
MKDRKTPRKPATKFPNLQKKLAKNKILGKRAKMGPVWCDFGCSLEMGKGGSVLGRK